MTTPYAPPTHHPPQPPDDHRPLRAEHPLLVALPILTSAAISFCVLLLLLICYARVTS
jgi:hypothetical protein